MARLLLPFKDWPVMDRRAWKTAIVEGDILDGQGPAAHWRAPTRRTNIQHYGRWLSYLKAHKELDGQSSPEDRVTPNQIQRYIKHIEPRLAPRTVVSSLVGLKVMLMALCPHKDWRWLADICNRLNRTARPTTDKQARMLDTDVIIKAALHRMDQLQSGPMQTRLDRVAYRDLVMLAFMAARPLRLRNFAGMIIGRHLRQTSDGWEILIPAEETKTRKELSFKAPAFLLPYLGYYLEVVRKSFLQSGQPTAALWLGFQGRPLSDHGAYQRFVTITKKLFGHAINPHLLRDCAATTLSSLSVNDAITAAALLGHHSFTTTQKHYIRARQLEASRKINTLINAVASQDRGDLQ